MPPPLNAVSGIARVSRTMGRLLPAVAILAAVGALAEDSDALHRGAEKMAQGDFSGALSEFDGAATGSPRDGEVLFFQGASLNRLGRFSEAHERLDSARQNGCAHPDLDFERGWALLGVNEWRGAVEALARYERQHPGRGQASEFLGRAHLALGDAAAARPFFTEAVRRDPDLKATVDPAAASMNDRPRHLPRFRTSETSRLALRGSVTVGGGYSTNVLGLSNDFKNTPGLPKREAGFVLTVADVALDWRIGERTTLTLSSGIQWITFDGVSAADILDVTAGAEVQHSFSEHLMGRAQFGFDHLLVGGDDYRDQWQVRPSVLWRQSDASTTELGFTFARADYAFALPASLNRDSLAYAADLTQHVALASGKVRVLVGGFVGWTDSKGRESDVRHAGVKAGVGATMPWALEAETVYSVSYDEFSNPSLLAVSRDRRTGTNQSVTVQLSRAFGQQLSVFLRYAYQLSESNVSFYENDHHLWMAGARWQF